MAHKNYRAPEGQEAFPLLVGVVLFLDVAGIQLSKLLLEFIPRFEQQPMDETKTTINVTGPLLQNPWSFGMVSLVRLGVEMAVSPEFEVVDGKGCVEFNHDLIRVVVKAWKSRSEGSALTARSEEAHDDKETRPFQVIAAGDYHEECDELFAGQVSFGESTWESSRAYGIRGNTPIMTRAYATDKDEGGYFHTVRFEGLPSVMELAHELISLVLWNFHRLEGEPTDVADE